MNTTRRLHVMWCDVIYGSVLWLTLIFSLKWLVGSSAFTFASLYAVRSECGCWVLLSVGNELNFTGSFTTIMYVWHVHTYVLMYMYVCVYLFIYLCMYVYIYMYVFVFIYVCMYVRMYMYVCVFIYLCMYVRICMCVYLFISLCMYVRIYTYVCVFIYLCMYACMYVCMYAWMYVCVCMCVCIMYVCMCTYTHTHTYIYIYVHTYHVCCACVRTYILLLNMVLPWYSYSQYPSISDNSLTVRDPEINPISTVRITLYHGAFTKCLCLVAFSNNMIRFHSKTALLWRFNAPCNNKTYLGLV